MSGRPNPFETDLDKNPANHAPLTPLSFIERTAYVYPTRTSVIHGARRYTWAETYARCRRLASALSRRGIGEGDTVAAMLANTPEMYECHFGVPMTGGVLLSLNTRLDASAISFMLAHGGAKVLITDREFSPTVKAALAFMKEKPEVIDVDDSEYAGAGDRLGAKTYEDLLAVGWACTRWPGNLVAASGWLFVAGSVIFSGSLYALSLTGLRWLGAITPIGGLALLAGWLCLAWAVAKG